MGYKRKAPKGEISIDNHRGKIRLRWRYNGVRYPLSLPYSYTPENMHHATIKIAEIKLDILKGCFDSTLEKYKPPVSKPIAAKATPTEHIPVYLNDFTGKFLEWAKNIRHANIDNSIDYMGLYKVLKAYATVPVKDIAGKIAKAKWAVSTYNKRLNFLHGFFSWLVDTGAIISNPLLHVNKRRDKKKRKNERRKPLSEEQITCFLEAIRNDTYSSKFSPFKHSFYYPFLKFIFITGVRNAEAIGLKVKHIDFDLGHIEISEALARTTKGTHHAARVSKGTKTENVRYLPLTSELSSLLPPLLRDKAPDDLVFLSPRGLSIDDRMLQKRVIKPVFLKLGLGNRDLYAARHSFGTRAVQQGMALTDVAYLMGHTTITTAANNYVGVEKPAIALPTMSKQERPVE